MCFGEEEKKSSSVFEALKLVKNSHNVCITVDCIIALKLQMSQTETARWRRTVSVSNPVTCSNGEKKIHVWTSEASRFLLSNLFLLLMQQRENLLMTLCCPLLITSGNKPVMARSWQKKRAQQLAPYFVYVRISSSINRHRRNWV